MDLSTDVLGDSWGASAIELLETTTITSHLSSNPQVRVLRVEDFATLIPLDTIGLLAGADRLKDLRSIKIIRVLRLLKLRPSRIIDGRGGLEEVRHKLN